MTSLTLRPGTPQETGMDPARVRGLSDLLACWVARGETPSAVACVARNGIVVLHEAHGVRHYADTTATLRPNSIFPVASISKPVTAACIMCLVEDGMIGLNRPFIEYVPEFDRPEVEWIGEATVADLLVHTAGLDDLVVRDFVLAGDRWATIEVPDVPGRHPTINRLIHLAAATPLAARPGTAMLYSGIGYMLLADIVRYVSGQPFWSFVQSRLFDPIGMRDSRFVLPPEYRGQRVYRAPGMPGTAATSPWMRGLDSAENDETDWGGNGLSTTAGDLVVFAQMLLNGGTYGERRVLSRASIAAMSRRHTTEGSPVVIPMMNAATGTRADLSVGLSGYGYGLFIQGAGDRWRNNGSLSSHGAFGHGGFGGNFFWADPATGIAASFLCVAPAARDFPYLTNADLFQNAVHAAIVD
jgi:serine-type D-Ala-D-Ala carboxypeptidase